jgi:uncharacterized membrane protein
MQIETSLDIAAPVATLWALTLDVEAWPRITPTTMTSVDLLQAGPLAVGSSARIKQPGQRSKVWTVTEFVPEQRFAWQTRSRWLAITGRHVLEPTAAGTRNHLVIKLDGPLSRAIGPLVGRSIRRTIETENQAFKAAAEG